MGACCARVASSRGEPARSPKEQTFATGPQVTGTHSLRSSSARATSCGSTVPAPSRCTRLPRWHVHAQKSAAATTPSGPAIQEQRSTSPTAWPAAARFRCPDIEAPRLKKSRNGYRRVCPVSPPRLRKATDDDKTVCGTRCRDRGAYAGRGSFGRQACPCQWLHRLHCGGNAAQPGRHDLSRLGALLQRRGRTRDRRRPEWALLRFV